jgi:hypothetical protein
MATIGAIELRLRAGFVKAPWWGLIKLVGGALVRMGACPDAVVRMAMPFSGLLWIRADEGGRRFILPRDTERPKHNPFACKSCLEAMEKPDA